MIIIVRDTVSTKFSKRRKPLSQDYSQKHKKNLKKTMLFFKIYTHYHWYEWTKDDLSKTYDHITIIKEKWDTKTIIMD